MKIIRLVKTFIKEGDNLVTNSIISEECTLYKEVIIKNSEIQGKSYVSDFSVLDQVVLADYARVGKNNYIFKTKMDKHSYTGQNTMLFHCEIGKYCSIAWNVTIGAGEHDYHRITTHSCLYNRFDEITEEPVYDRLEKKTMIGNDVWIGAGAYIKSGVSVGDGAVIGANAVVTHDVNPYEIVVGNPAKIIKKRCLDNLVERLRGIAWWNWPEQVMRANIDLISSDITEENILKMEVVNREIVR